MNHDFAIIDRQWHNEHVTNGSWPRRVCSYCRLLTAPQRVSRDAGREPPWSYNPEETLRDVP